MNKSEAIQSIKNLNVEASSLYPSALLHFFEIDLGDILFGRGIASQNELDTESKTVFRFHNSIKISTNSIIWRGKEYIAAPIQADGFEMALKGVLPTPKLSLFVNDEASPHLARLKDRLYQLSNDIVGAKVTRIRTFAKFIDAVNFYDSLPPPGFSPDPLSSFPADVFFIDRKSSDNKNSLVYELASVLDIEQIKLPSRLVLEHSCSYQYRDGNCGYEYDNRRNSAEHDLALTLPVSAISAATDSDELMEDLLPDIAIVDKGEYHSDIVYNKGDQIFITHGNLKYYFVAKVDGTSLAPPNQTQWLADKCSKSFHGCEIRFGIAGKADGNITKGLLRYGGYPGISRFK